MMTSVLDTARNMLPRFMGQKRLSHTLGVERAVIALGERLLPDRVTELRLAALLHDIAKEMPKEEKERELAEHHLLTDAVRYAPELAHGYLAPYILARELPEAYTEELADAIRYHTTGRSGMSTFEKILFLADYIEDGRAYPDCIEVREHFFKRIEETTPERALDECVLSSMDKTIGYLIRHGLYIAEDTVLGRNDIMISLSRL